jgi:hypothetical protein
LQSELVILVIVTINELYGQSCIEIFPAGDWTLEKVIVEVSVRGLQLHITAGLRNGAVCAEARDLILSLEELQEMLER